MEKEIAFLIALSGACYRASDLVQNRESAFKNIESNLDTEIANDQVAYNSALSEQIQATKDYESAKSEYERLLSESDYTAKLADANKKIEDAENRLKLAEQALDKAQEDYNYVGKAFIDAYAVKTIDELIESGKSKPEIAEKVDTYAYNIVMSQQFSEENMRASIAFIRECNELRAKHGLNALLVDFNLFANSLVSNAVCAESGTLHIYFYYMPKSDKYMRNENLYWGYSNPFDGWYTKEKAIYDEYGPMRERGNSTGHYENIVNSEWRVTGFASSNFSYQQSFSSHTGLAGAIERNLDNAITIDEYEKMFNQFVQKAKSELNNAKAEKTNSEKTLADAKYTKASIEDEASNNTDIKNAKSKLDTALAAKSDADIHVDEISNELNNAVALRQKTDTVDSNVPSTYADFPTLVKADKDVDDANKSLANAATAYNNAIEQVKLKSTAVGVATNAYNEADEAVKSAEAVLSKFNASEPQITVTVKNVVYNGKVQKPTVTAIYNGETITDFTVKYSNNKAIGQGTATVTFNGRFEGAKTVAFNILPPTAKIKAPAKAKGALTVKWAKFSKKNQKLITGFQIQVSPNKDFSGAKTVTAKKTLASKKVTKLAKNKTYYVRVRSCSKVKGKTIYGNWSAVKSAKTK